MLQVQALPIDPYPPRTVQTRPPRHVPVGRRPVRSRVQATCADISPLRPPMPPVKPRVPMHSLDPAEVAHRVRAGIRVLQRARAVERGGARSIEDDHAMAGTPLRED